jgi:hypothetical protein
VKPSEQHAEQPYTLRFWQHAVVFLLACAVIISRRPDAVFHAQFYAEDGHVWLADAYNLGWWPALFRTWTGYFLTLPRLGGSLALLVPLAKVPLLLNLIAICFQALPVTLLLSSRSSSWGSLRFRAFLAAIYLVLPNCTEVSYGITDANFLLALSALLTLLSSPPKTSAARIFDSLLILLCGLSGPFCIFLLPVSLFFVWKHRDRLQWISPAILFACCALQAWALLFLAPHARSHRLFGASPVAFARILAGHVYLGALLGGNGLALQPGFAFTILLACIAIGGTALVFVCFRNMPLVMKAFLLFSLVLIACSLIAPVEWGRPDLSVWTVLAGSPGHRYWFFPTLAFAWSLAWGCQSRTSSLKPICTVLLCIMCFGILRDWRHPAFRDTQFAASVKRFENAPAGSAVTIPEYPLGWSATLIKHNPAR